MQARRGRLLPGGDPDELLERQTADGQASVERALEEADSYVAALSEQTSNAPTEPSPGAAFAEFADNLRRGFDRQLAEADAKLQSAAAQYHDRYVEQVKASLPPNAAPADIDRGLELCRENRRWLDAVLKDATAAREGLQVQLDSGLRARAQLIANTTSGKPPLTRSRTRAEPAGVCLRPRSSPQAMQQAAQGQPPAQASSAVPPLPVAPSSCQPSSGPETTPAACTPQRSLASVIEGKWIVESREPYGFGILHINMKKGLLRRRFESRSLGGPAFTAEGTWEILPENRLALTWDHLPGVGRYSAYLTFLSIGEAQMAAISPTGGQVIWLKQV